MFLTTVTFLIFLSSMNSPMVSKFVISSKAPAIYIIFIWFLLSELPDDELWMIVPKWFVKIFYICKVLSSMNCLMNCKVCIHTESPATYTSFIWFLSSMNSLMNTKFSSMTKRLAIYITFIWFLSSMNTSMNSKV